MLGSKCFLIFAISATVPSILLYVQLNHHKILDKTHINSRKNTDQCDSLHHTGKWKNFKNYGFSRTIESESISNVYHPKYPMKMPFLHDFPDKQNFTGEWIGENGCELKQMTKSELETCFRGPDLKRFTSIRFIGDSRTRQIYKATKSHLMNSTWFLDDKSVTNEKISIDGVVNISYYWSNGFENKVVNIENHYGNHLNWRLNTLKKVKRSGTIKQVVTHSAIINVLLNTYCRKLPDAVNKKYCCF